MILPTESVYDIPTYSAKMTIPTPTKEADYIIKNLTLTNQVVLDPLMGSGTTGIAALNLKRKFIGLEKNPETFEIASIRINKLKFERIREEDDY